MSKLTKTEFQEKLKDIRASIFSEAKPFSDASATAAEFRRKKAKDDLFYFALTYLPHYFDDPFSKIHKQMIAAAETKEKPVLIVSAGGFGKSTVVTLLKTLHAICFEKHHFIVLGGMTEDVAMQPVMLAKLELEENERLKADFGDLKSKYRWEDADFVTSNNVRVKARGVGQAFRGLRWKQYRPSLVILDDIEDQEVAIAPRRVEKTLSWIVATVLPRMDVKGWQLIVVGNIINRAGVIGHLLYHPDYASFIRKVFPAIDPSTGRPTWQARFDYKTLSNLKKVMGHVRYSAEMLCAPIDDTHYFRPEMTHFYDASLLDAMQDVCAYIDPSVTESKQGDYKAIVAIGHLPNDHREYVCGCWIRHGTNLAMVNAAYKLDNELQFKQLGLESNGFQRFLKREFDAEALKRGRYLPLQLSGHYEAKSIRIERLVAGHDNGDLLFCKDVGDTPLLLEQLYNWEPQGREHDDGPDALAGAIELRRGAYKKARFRTVRR